MAKQTAAVPAEGTGRFDWSGEITPAGAAGGRGAGADRTTAGSGGGNQQTGGTGGGHWPGVSTPAQVDEEPAEDWLTQSPGGVTGWSGNAPVPDGNTSRNGFRLPAGNMNTIGQDIENNLPPNEIGAPDSLEEVFRGSMKALLLRNIGNYVVATFLIGTQGTVSWEGILYDVGNDYLAIYQTGRDQYIVSDLYSLKYVEFYDTRRRQMCEELLSQQSVPAS